MFTWISDQMRVLAFFALALLTACDGIGLEFPGRKPTAQTEIVVTRDQVKLSGPPGFCVDAESTRNTPDSAFVVFGNCAAITGSRKAEQPLINAIATASVTQNDPGVPKISQSGEQLQAFFLSPVGQSVLSRSNSADTVTVEEGQFADGSLFIYVTDTSEGAPVGTEETYWRGYFDVKNSVVTVSVLSLGNTPLGRDSGLDLLRGFEQRMRVAPSTSSITPTKQPSKPTAFERIGRLFR